MIRSIAAAAALFVAGCSGGAYPTLDGACDEYAGLKAEMQPLGDNVRLLIFQDAANVWLCAALPPESYGTLDLVIEAPALAEALNLHVSAQLGEWPANDPEAAPASAGAEGWWKISGWSAFPMRMNGFIERADGRRPNYLHSPGRELQLSKARFGKGDWRLRLAFQGIASDDGNYTTVTFPSDDEAWFTLKAK